MVLWKDKVFRLHKWGHQSTRDKQTTNLLTSQPINQNINLDQFMHFWNNRKRRTGIDLAKSVKPLQLVRRSIRTISSSLIQTLITHAKNNPANCKLHLPFYIGKIPPWQLTSLQLFLFNTSSCLHPACILPSSQQPSQLGIEQAPASAAGGQTIPPHPITHLTSYSFLFSEVLFYGDQLIDGVELLFRSNTRNFK